MSSHLRNTLNAGITALMVGAATITLVPTPASAFGLGGFSHMGGFSGTGGFGHTGGLGSLGAGRSFGNLGQSTKISKLGNGTHTNPGSRSNLRQTSETTKTGSKSASDIDSKPSTKTGTGTTRTTANGDRPVGGGMYEKAGTGTTANGDRPVGGDDGHGVAIIPVPVPLVPFDPDQVTVSYGSTPEVGLVRVDDLPQNKKRVQNDCALLQAKVQYLMNKLAQQLRVLAALQGAQNVAYSGTITGVSTTFASPEDAQYAIDRIQADIAATQQLLALYQADLARCLAK